MRLEMGSVTILYDWFDLIKRKANKNVQVQIAEQLSEGLNYGQFHYSFDGVTDLVGWYVVADFG